MSRWFFGDFRGLKRGSRPGIRAGFSLGRQGAAAATVIAQFVSGVGIAVYVLMRAPELRIKKRHRKWDAGIVREIASLSFLTSMQQSIMNFGILLIQGLVNSFGTVVMAAFAAAVKINSFAYMPAQDFGNAFSTFIAQNFGAGRHDRIHKGIRSAVLTVFLFCAVISVFVCVFARPLIGLFVQPGETEILAVGVQYLRIEGACYFGIGLLAALRVLPGHAPSRHFGRIDRHLAGHPRPARLYAGAHPCNRRYRHLGRRPDRLAAGRRYGRRLPFQALENHTARRIRLTH